MSIISQRLARAEASIPKPLDDPASPIMQELARIVLYMAPDYTNDGPPGADPEIVKLYKLIHREWP